MSEFTTQQLIDLIESGGGQWRAYSGRGMSGAECVSIETDDVLALVADMMTTCGSMEDVERLAHAIGTARTDAMGRSAIFYFPRHRIGQEGAA